MHASHLFDAVFASMGEAMLGQAMQGQTLNAEQQKIRDDMLTRLVSLLREQLNWTKLEPLMIQAYQGTFNQKDVNALTKFYASPAGQSVANKLPRMTQQTMQYTQQGMRDLMPRIQELARDAGKRMREAATPDSQSGSPPPAGQPSAPPPPH